jgi:hypothetical protein
MLADDITFTAVAQQCMLRTQSRHVDAIFIPGIGYQCKRERTLGKTVWDTYSILLSPNLGILIHQRSASCSLSRDHY